MDDQNRAQEQLIEELNRLRRRTAELEAVESGHRVIQEELRRSEERFRALVESASDVTVVLGSQGNIIYLSPNFEKVWGFKAEGVLGQDLFKNIHPDDIPEIGKKFTEIIKNPKTLVRMPIRALYPDGTWHTLDAEARNHLDDPAICGIVVNFHDITELKRAEVEVQRQEKRFQAIAENSSDVILLLDAKGTIVYESPAIEHILGLNPTDRAGANMLERVHPEDVHTVTKHFQILLQNPDAPVQRIELRLRHKDGSWRTVEASGSAVAHDTVIEGLVINIRDITERKRAEVDLCDAFKQWQATFDATSDAVCLLDPEQRVQRCNRAMTEMFNVGEKELIGKHCWEVVHGTKEPVDGCPVTQIKESLHREEMDLQRGDRWYNVAADPVLDDNRAIKGIIHVVRDITASKKADEMIQRQERYFRSLIENNSDGIMVLNRDGTIRYESPSNLRLLGYTAEERIGKSVFEPIHPDDVPIVATAFEKVISGTLERAEVRARHKNGSWRFVEATASNFLDDPAIGGVVVNMRDITDRRESERALRESEEKLRILFQTVGVGITVTDMSGEIIDVNAELLKLTGFDRKEEVIGRNGFDFISEKDRDRAAQALSNNLASGLGVPIELTLLRKDGSEYLADTDTTVMQDANGNPIGLIVTHRDITERKRAEAALRESEEKYAMLVENATDGVTIIQDQVIKFASRRMSEMSGYTVEELTGMSTFDLVPPDFLPELKKRFAQREQNQPVSETFYTKMLCKDGTVKEIENSTRLIQYQGKPAALGISRDITERRRMEETLRESEEKNRALIENIRDAIFIIKDAKIKYANEGFAEITGYSVSELIGKGIDKLVAPEDLAMVADRYVRRMKGEQVPREYEFKLVKKDGVTRVDVIMDVGVITYEGGPAAMGIGRDITERKRMENALRASEERYRLLAENASDVIMLMDMNARAVYFSPSVARLLGYSVEEALTGSMEGRMTPSSMEKAVKHFMAGLHRERRKPGGSAGQTLELEMIHKNGSIVIVEMMVSFIRDENGKPTGMMAILRDLTERKKAEKEIVALSNAFKAARDPIIIFDMQGNVVNANEAAHQLFERDDVGSNALETVAPEDRDRVASVLQDLISSGQSAAVRFNIVTRSGRRVSVEASGSIIRDAEGKSVGIVVVERDLTERRQAESRQKLAAEILGILNEPLALPDAINRILAAIKRETGFYAVGIRLKKDEDFPYFVQSGFSEDFLLTENTIVVRDSHGGICRDKDGNVSLECTCGLVLSGKTDPSNPLFTAGGSAWTNDSPTLLDVPLEQDPRLHPRNRCIHAGFQSVALMPIRSGNKIVGLLQLNDRRKGCFTPEMIRFFEGIAASIGVALMRKQTEEALRESEKKMRSLFEVSPDVIMTIDRQGKILFINRATTSTIEETIGTSVYDYIPTEYQSLYAETVENVFRTGKPDRIETCGLGPGRRMSWYEARFVLLESEGKQQTLMVVATDITERKEADEALKESEEKFRTAFDSANIGICLVGLSGNLIKVNDKMSEILGYSVEDLERMTVNDIAYPEDRDVSPRFMEKAIGGKVKSSIFENRYISKEGKTVYGLVSSALVHDADGEPIYFISQMQDITERKRAEGALRLSEEKHRMVADLSQDIICTLDVNGATTYASPAVERILGYKPDEVVGRNVFDFVSAKGRQDLVNQFMKITEEGKNLNNVEVEEIRKDGLPVFVEYNNSFIKDGDKTIGVLAIGRDVTERKKAQQALKASEIKYRDLFEHTLLGMEVVDGQSGKVILANHAMARIFEFKSPEDMVGVEAISDHILPEDMDWVLQQFAQAIADTERHEVATLRAKTVDGRIIWVTGSATSFEYEGKQSVLISLIDVTAAKEAEDKLRESEERIKSIVSTSQEWIWAIDPKGNHTFSNPAIENILGYRPDEIIGKDSLRLIHADDAATARQLLSRCVKLKTGWANLVVRWKHKDGGYRYLESNAVPILDSYGVVSGFQGTDRDITDRKKAEETLIRISKAVESSSDAIGMSDPQGHHFYHNKAFTELFEYTPEELEAAGGGPAAFANKHVARKVFDTIMGGGSWTGEVEMVSKSGRKFTVLERADAIKDEKGKVIGLVGVHTDITERKKAEEKLRETRDYMENLIEHANVPMVVWTPDFRITRFNRAFERLTGMKAKAVIGKDLEILFPKGTGERSMSFIRTAMRGARWEVVEIPIANVDGGVRTVLWNISPVYAEDGKTPMAIIAQGQDITERKKAEEALRESEELSRSMLDNAAMGIYLLQNKKFIYVNPTFEKIIGYSGEELMGQEAINYVHPDDRDIVRAKAVENIQEKSVQPYEFRALRKDGRQIWVMERVTPVRYKGRRAVLASFMETTEHKKAEVELERAYEELKTAHERMVQSEKLRAMGEMASGIAHDFNNMLAVILGRTQLVIDDVKDDKVKKGIQIIEQAALDAAKTVKRLQDFARIRVEHPFEPLDVNEVVEGVLKMVESRRVELEQTRGIAIRVEQELGKTGRVSGDAAELREALLNILFNALDAMPTGGKLTVKTSQDEEWVQITIKDTGVGIPDKVKSKVFQPFFTTKASKGSGLGLSVTYGIISRHSGMIKFDSEVGKGTTFYIRLPLAVEEAKKQAKKSKAVAAKPASILTVDDEPEVLKALGLTLEYFGHWVKDFTRGADAIKAFKDGKYDIVITDLGMPEMSGWDVARAIKKIKPDVPVLLITGWVIDLDEEKKKLVDGVIAKPFSRESIASAISGVFPAKKKRVVKKKTAAKKKSK